MKLFKTIASLMLALTLLTGVSSAAFLDVDANSEIGKAIETLSSRGVISGYGNGFSALKNRSPVPRLSRSSTKFSAIH